MTLAEIKKAVDEGKKVHWKNENYLVIKDSIGQYLLQYLPESGNYVGIETSTGELNESEDAFYIAEEKDNKTLLEENRDNSELLREIVRAVNSWDGSLESLEVYDFDDEFFNMFFEGNVINAVQRTFFGNIQSWNDEYIRFNGYGNLESLSSFDYEKELEDNADEIIERALDLEGDIDLTDIIENNI